MPGSDQVIRNLQEWERKQRAALLALGMHYAGLMGASARENAPWEDKTTHARDGLFGDARNVKDGLRVRISHSMEYGVYLELCNQGRYAILEPTVNKFADDFFREAEEVLRR